MLSNFLPQRFVWKQFAMTFHSWFVELDVFMVFIIAITIIIFSLHCIVSSSSMYALLKEMIFDHRLNCKSSNFGWHASTNFGYFNFQLSLEYSPTFFLPPSNSPMAKFHLKSNLGLHSFRLLRCHYTQWQFVF